MYKNSNGHSDSGMGSSTFSLSLLANHFPALHGLRVLAIICVVQIHITLNLKRALGLPESPFFTYSQNIFFGMDLFFFLSGFLIGTILLHSVQNKSLGSIGRFYVRRGFRTFPLYYFVLTMMFLFWPMAPSRYANILSEYLYLTNYGSSSFHTHVMYWGWSLSVEEHFYLAAPLLIAALHILRTHRARITSLMAIWSTGFFVRILALASNTGLQALYIRTHTRFDILIAGVILAYVQYYFRKQIKSALHSATVRAIMWTIPVLGALLLVFKPSALGGDTIVFQLLSVGTITSIMYVPLILLLVNTKGPVVRFLSAPVFLPIATLGYGIYLVHTPVCTALLRILRPILGASGVSAYLAWSLLLVATLVTSAAIAYGLHILIEKPSLYVRDLLTNAKAAKPFFPFRAALSRYNMIATVMLGLLPFSSYLRPSNPQAQKGGDAL